MAKLYVVINNTHSVEYIDFQFKKCENKFEDIKINSDKFQ